MFKLQNKVINLPPKLEYFLNSVKVTLVSLVVTIGAVVIAGFLIDGLELSLNIYSILIGFAVLIAAFVLCFLIYIKTFIKVWEKTFKITPTGADIILPTVGIVIFGFIVWGIINGG